nr:MAG: hypothetical protein DIU78_08670 [Pseudomonadota bacterium]
MENSGATPIEGFLDVERRSPSRPGGALRTRIPFSLAPGARASVEAPTHGGLDPFSAPRIVARTNDGRELAIATVSESPRIDVLVLDLESPSRLAPALRGMLIPSTHASPPGFSGVAMLGAASPPVNPATGDLVLPTFAAGYSAATLVVASSRAISQLAAAERAALAHWVLAGGALALAIPRPEDLAASWLEDFVGTRPEIAPAPPELTAGDRFFVPSEDGSAPPSQVELAPSSEVASTLTSYQGGNLRPSPWGASASYGLGEVHLLAFDPHVPNVVTDPWVRHKLADLARHAHERRPHVGLRHAAIPPSGSNVTAIRQLLDPNQASRWTIAVSALALLAYAALAGPLGFYLAAKRGRPLRALALLPVWSALAFGLVVAFGTIGKGLSGKARRLTLAEAGAGMTRAAAVRFRAFYTPSSSDLVIRPAARSHVLDLAGQDVPERLLVLDRDGPHLTGVRTRPWQTLLVREDGFVDLSGGVSIVADGQDYLVKNRTAATLLGVIVRVPGGQSSYFPRIADGESVRVSQGRALGPIGGAYPGVRGRPLEASRLAQLLEADHPGLGRAWLALEPALSHDVAFWSDHVPVLIAAIEGGEGRLTDSGYAVDVDRLLVRVVGTGGIP